MPDCDSSSTNDPGEQFTSEATGTFANDASGAFANGLVNGAEGGVGARVYGFPNRCTDPDAPVCEEPDSPLAEAAMVVEGQVVGAPVDTITGDPAGQSSRPSRAGVAVVAVRGGGVHGAR